MEYQKTVRNRQIERAKKLLEMKDPEETALLIYRLLEAKLDDQDTHVTTGHLITTLKNMNVTNIHDVEYMALYKGSRTLTALTRAASLELDRLHYRPKDLNGIIQLFYSLPLEHHNDDCG